MYLMPTRNKYRSSFTGAGVVSNSSYHLARLKDGEIKVVCGSENVDVSAKPLAGDMPIGVCKRCKQLAKLK